MMFGSVLVAPLGRLLARAIVLTRPSVAKARFGHQLEAQRARARTAVVPTRAVLLVRLTINGREIGHGMGGDVMGNPLNALAWLADKRTAVADHALGAAGDDDSTGLEE